VTSWWIAAAFFFLLRPAAPLLLDRAESTDLFVEGHQVLAELLEAVKLGDLPLGLAQGGGIGKGLRHRLAGHAASETELRVMSRIVAFGALAGPLAAAGSQITQAEELLQELGSFGLQVATSSGIRFFFFTPDCLYLYRRSEQCHKKKEKKKGIPQHGACMSPTHV
jgi:hypothetical protein